MQLTVFTKDPEYTDEIVSKLYNDLKEVDSQLINVQLSLDSTVSSSNNESTIKKGEPAIMTIILTLVGAGGALTVALGKGGLISQIASIFETYLKREVVIKIKSDKSEIYLKGPAKQIEKTLLRVFQGNQIGEKSN